LGRLGLGEDVGGEQQELVRVDLLAGSTEPLSEQSFELVLNVADEESLLAERFEQILDEAVAGVQVSGKLDGPIFHKHNYIVIYYYV